MTCNYTGPEEEDADEQVQIIRELIEREQVDGLAISVIDADKIAHQITAPHTKACKAIVEHFGNSILTTDYAINRKDIRRRHHGRLIDKHLAFRRCNVHSLPSESNLLDRAIFNDIGRSKLSWEYVVQ